MWNTLISKFKKKHLAQSAPPAASSEVPKKFKPDKQSLNINLACYYDPKTILTRSGTLFRVVKFESFVSYSNLSIALKNFIQKFANYEVAFWIYSIRRAANASSEQGSSHSNNFIREINESYITQNLNESPFINEVYVAIVTAPPAAELGKILRAFVPSAIYNRFSTYLQTSLTNLEEMIKNLLNELASFNPQVLGIKKDGTCDLYGFLNFLLNPTLPMKLVPVPDIDLAVDLLKSRSINTGFNSLEINEGGINYSGKKKVLSPLFQSKNLAEI